MKAPKWTAGAVVDALRTAYGVAGSDLITEEWAFLTEVPLRSPGGRGGSAHALDRWSANQRTIDVFLVRTWAGGIGHRRVAIEVKVTRADYRQETDAKRAPAEDAAHHTYYAAPAGLIDPATLPPGWGLLEVHTDPKSHAAAKGWPVGDHLGARALVKCRTRPAVRAPSCDLNYLASALARRASRAEERIRVAADDVHAVPGLRAEVETLRGQVERRETALAASRQQTRDVKTALLAMEGGQVCGTCGHQVGLRGGSGFTWAHRDPAHEEACAPVRAEADRIRREKNYGARYVHGFAGPVLPRALAEEHADVGL